MRGKDGPGSKAKAMLHAAGAWRSGDASLTSAFIDSNLNCSALAGRGGLAQSTMRSAMRSAFGQRDLQVFASLQARACSPTDEEERVLDRLQRIVELVGH